MVSPYVRLAEIRVLMDNHGIPTVATFTLGNPDEVPFVTAHYGDEWCEIRVTGNGDQFAAVYSHGYSRIAPITNAIRALGLFVGPIRDDLLLYLRSCHITLKPIEGSVCPVCVPHCGGCDQPIEMDGGMWMTNDSGWTCPKPGTSFHAP